MDRHTLPVQSASVSEDRKRVFLEIPNIKPGYVVHGALFADLTSADGESAWAAEWWTTVNQLPSNLMGKTRSAPANTVEIDTHSPAKKSPHALALTVYAENCQSCHKTTSERLIGPGLAGLLGKKQTILRNGQQVDVTIDKPYLRRSILQPSHEHPMDYHPIMPALGDSLSTQQVDALVEWIASLNH